MLQYAFVSNKSFYLRKTADETTDVKFIIICGLGYNRYNYIDPNTFNIQFLRISIHRIEYIFEYGLYLHRSIKHIVAGICYILYMYINTLTLHIGVIIYRRADGCVM